jgi:hypothetical protein
VEAGYDYIWYKTDQDQGWSVNRRLTGIENFAYFSTIGYFAVRLTSDSSTTNPVALVLQWGPKCRGPCSDNQLEVWPCNKDLLRVCVPSTLFTSLSGSFTLASFQASLEVPEERAWIINTTVKR